jgi:predicted peptidase
MKPTPSHLLTALLAFAGVGLSTAHAAENQMVASFTTTVTKTVTYQYLVSLPTGYDAAGDKKWPVLLFLHGSGERGSDPWLVAKHGPPKLIRGPVPTPPPTPGALPGPVESPEARARAEAAGKMLRENFIVISPQCPAGTGWNDDAVLALLDQVVATHQADPHRLYLTGLSLGGYATWSIAMKNPQRFAAVVPICGGGQRSDVVRNRGDQKAALLSLGVWAFHGAKDPTVPLDESERMVDVLKKSGVTDVQLTVYPEAKHDSWTEAYSTPELYTWLLKHERGAPAAKTK